MKLKDLFDELSEHNFKSSLFEDLKLIKNIDTCVDVNINTLDSEVLENLIKQYDNSKYPSITCGILTYNEERCIKRCLENITDEFNEVIVLDSYSTDATVRIINENFSSVKVFFKPWIEDFSFHRNKIIEFASSDWIYFIDADNWYDADNKGKIRRIAKLINFLNIKCVISPMICEHDGHIYTDNRKMFALKDKLHFAGKVHEEPIFTDGNIPENITVDIMVHHDGYNPKFVDQLQKNSRNIKLTKQMMELEPSNPKWLYFYARELYQVKEEVERIHPLLLKAITLYGTSTYKRYQPEAILLLCKIYFQTGQFRKLSECLDLLENLHPHCTDVNYYRAMLLFFDIRVKTKKLKDSLKLDSFSENEKKYSFISSSNEHIKVLLIQLHWYLDDWENAITLYKEMELNETKQELERYFQALKNNVYNIV